MNKKQVLIICEFKAISERPEIIPEQLQELSETGGICSNGLNLECLECQACEIFEILQNPEDYQ